jgi:hypothetical protein
LKDPASKLLDGNGNAKSDVANKLISMFLHELSRRASNATNLKVKSRDYVRMVRESFGNLCPYCSRTLTLENSVVEHLDGMNRLRAGLHVPGNVLVACKECNNRKRLDDSRAQTKLLAGSGWASFLSHDGARCDPICKTCDYWKRIWPDEAERKTNLCNGRAKIQLFRDQFDAASSEVTRLSATLSARLIGLYSNCQTFAEEQIESLIGEIHQGSDASPKQDGIAQSARAPEPKIKLPTSVLPT